MVVQNFKLLEVPDRKVVPMNPKSAELPSMLRLGGKNSAQYEYDKSAFYNLDRMNLVINEFVGKKVAKSSANLAWTSNRKHSIVAIAEDTDGNILFLHAENPLTIRSFIDLIRDDESLNLNRALYTEGGGQASMSLTTGSVSKYWFGRNSLLLMFTGQNRLPNIIGVKRK